MADNNYKFQAPGTVRTTNRVNTSGQPPKQPSWLGAIRVKNVIPANSSLQVPAYGTQFYFRVLTATVLVKTNTTAFSPYSQGEGQNFSFENAFSLLELRNDNPFPVVFELCIAFDSFIDNKLILAADTDFRVAFPTYDTPNSAPIVNIVDKSGAEIQDINGKRWYALCREEINVFNADPGVTLLLQKAGSLVSNGPAVGIIYPLTAIRFGFGGNYCLNLGGANINAIVHEVYRCIPATIV